MKSAVPPNRGGHETNVSAEQQASKTHARVSRTHGDTGRARGSEAPSSEGTQATDGVDTAEATPLASTRERFPRASRLRQRRDFQRVERSGKRVGGAHFVVFVQPRSGPGRRLGVTVSRKVGGAVTRNRVKRLVREVFRRRMLTLLPGDTVVIARTGAGKLLYRGAARELSRLWAQVSEAATA